MCPGLWEQWQSYYHKWCYVLAFFFVLYWVASANMFLASWSNLLIVLLLALLETVVASYFASRLYLRKNA